MTRRQDPDYTEGQIVNWVGTASLPSRKVIIKAAWPVHFAPGTWLYDIADPDTGEVLLFAATARELASAEFPPEVTS